MAKEVEYRHVVYTVDGKKWESNWNPTESMDEMKNHCKKTYVDGFDRNAFFVLIQYPNKIYIQCDKIVAMTIEFKE